MIGNSDSYISYNLYAYCENNPVNCYDLTGYGKTYVFYHKDFTNQVKKSGYFYTNNPNVITCLTSSPNEFIKQWNKMPYNVDYVFLYFHGFSRHLNFNGNYNYGIKNTRK